MTRLDTPAALFFAAALLACEGAAPTPASPDAGVTLSDALVSGADASLPDAHAPGAPTLTLAAIPARAFYEPGQRVTFML